MSNDSSNEQGNEQGDAPVWQAEVDEWLAAIERTLNGQILRWQDEERHTTRFRQGVEHGLSIAIGVIIQARAQVQESSQP